MIYLQLQGVVLIPVTRPTGYKVMGAMEATVSNIALSENQRMSLLGALESEMDELLESFAEQLRASGSERLQELGQHVFAADRYMSDLIIPQLDQQTHARRVSRAYEIERALEDFQMGDYGFCESCEQPISYRALKDDPVRRNCIRCQHLARDIQAPVKPESQRSAKG